MSAFLKSIVVVVPTSNAVLPYKVARSVAFASVTDEVVDGIIVSFWYSAIVAVPVIPLTTPE